MCKGWITDSRPEAEWGDGKQKEGRRGVGEEVGISRKLFLRVQDELSRQGTRHKHFDA